MSGEAESYPLPLMPFIFILSLPDEVGYVKQFLTDGSSPMASAIWLATHFVLPVPEK